MAPSIEDLRKTREATLLEEQEKQAKLDALKNSAIEAGTKPKVISGTDAALSAILNIAPALFGQAIAGKQGLEAGLEAGIGGHDAFLSAVKERIGEERLADQEKARELIRQSDDSRTAVRSAQSGLTDFDEKLALGNQKFERDKEMARIKAANKTGEISTGEGLSRVAEALGIGRAGASTATGAGGEGAVTGSGGGISADSAQTYLNLLEATGDSKVTNRIFEGMAKVEALALAQGINPEKLKQAYLDTQGKELNLDLSGVKLTAAKQDLATSQALDPLKIAKASTDADAAANALDTALATKDNDIAQSDIATNRAGIGEQSDALKLIEQGATLAPRVEGEFLDRDLKKEGLESADLTQKKGGLEVTKATQEETALKASPKIGASTFEFTERVSPRGEDKTDRDLMISEYSNAVRIMSEIRDTLETSNFFTRLLTSDKEKLNTKRKQAVDAVASALKARRNRTGKEEAHKAADSLVPTISGLITSLSRTVRPSKKGVHAAQADAMQELEDRIISDVEQVGFKLNGPRPFARPTRRTGDISEGATRGFTEEELDRELSAEKEAAVRKALGTEK